MTESLKDIVGKGAEYLTKDQHVRFLRWKLANGKNRPMLLKYAMELTDAQVVAVSREAFALCRAGKHIAAVEKYRTLKGTGYALASLALSTQCTQIPFMSDTLLEQVLGTTMFKYTKKEFMACYDAHNAKA